MHRNPKRPKDGLFRDRQLFSCRNVFTIQPLKLSSASDLNKTFRIESRGESCLISLEGLTRR